MGCISSKKLKAESCESIGKTNVKKTSSRSGSGSGSGSIKSSKTTSQKPIFDDIKAELNIDLNDAEQRSVTPPTQRRQSKTNRKQWTDEQLLGQLKLLNHETSSNIVRMFDEGSTIPFMCRYRRELIGNLSADE